MTDVEGVVVVIGDKHFAHDWAQHYMVKEGTLYLFDEVNPISVPARIVYGSWDLFYRGTKKEDMPERRYLAGSARLLN